jgi:hypothetical protein
MMFCTWADWGIKTATACQDLFRSVDKHRDPLPTGHAASQSATAPTEATTAMTRSEDENHSGVFCCHRSLQITCPYRRRSELFPFHDTFV